MARTFSDGSPATLGTLRKWAMVFSGNDEASKVVRFVDTKIAECPNGENEEVIADESQILMLLSSMLR